MDASAYTETVKHFINLDVDTIVYNGDEYEMFLPKNIKFVCGKCNRVSNTSRNGRTTIEKQAYDICNGCLLNTRTGRVKTIGRLAISYSSWLSSFAPATFNRELTMRPFQMYYVRELFIMVGNMKAIKSEKDFILATALWGSESVVWREHREYQETETDDTQDGGEDTQENRSTETSDKDGQNISGWKVTKVGFVNLKRIGKSK